MAAYHYLDYSIVQSFLNWIIEKFNVILHNLKLTNNYLDKININDIIYLLNKFEIDIKIKPIEIMQIVMFTIQKKFNLEFKYSDVESLNKYANCIEVYDSNKKLRGYIHIDLLARDTKNINQITVIKLNNQYKENLPNVYLLGYYSDLQNEMINLYRSIIIDWLNVPDNVEYLINLDSNTKKIISNPICGMNQDDNKRLIVNTYIVKLMQNNIEPNFGIFELFILYQIHQIPIIVMFNGNYQYVIKDSIKNIENTIDESKKYSKYSRSQESGVTESGGRSRLRKWFHVFRMS
jgi:hypothetical protein